MRTVPVVRFLNSTVRNTQVRAEEYVLFSAHALLYVAVALTSAILCDFRRCCSCFWCSLSLLAMGVCKALALAAAFHKTPDPSGWKRFVHHGLEEVPSFLKPQKLANRTKQYEKQHSNDSSTRNFGPISHVQRATQQ